MLREMRRDLKHEEAKLEGMHPGEQPQLMRGGGSSCFSRLRGKVHRKGSGISGAEFMKLLLGPGYKKAVGHMQP